MLTTGALDRPRLVRYGPAVIVVALLIATAVAFFAAEHLKLERSPIQRPRVTTDFSPACDCPTNAATIAFRLRRRERVTIDVVGGNGKAATRLVAAQDLARGPHSFVWDGRDDGGLPVRDGTYRVRITLAREGRTITIPNTITLDTVRPTATPTAPIRPTVFSPDRDGRAEGISVHYRMSEPAHALLYVNGRLLARNHPTEPVGRISWYGGHRGRIYPPGRYRVSLGARDLAGNLAVPRAAGVVRIRFVELARRRIRAVAGRRFRVRVSTDAKTVSWRLRRRHGVAHPPVLVLRAPATPGRYRLYVIERGHAARAVIVVSRRS